MRENILAATAEQMYEELTVEQKTKIFFLKCEQIEISPMEIKLESDQTTTVRSEMVFDRQTFFFTKQFIEVFKGQNKVDRKYLIETCKFATSFIGCELSDFKDLQGNTQAKLLLKSDSAPIGIIKFSQISNGMIKFSIKLDQ